ncbi:hypothetical protein CsSME_00002996 [Camellia sinensis var. sinensis]
MLKVRPRVVVDSEEQIVQGIFDFYSKLFSKDEIVRPRINGLEWRPIDQESATWLERPFEEIDIRDAIFEWERDKAPGPDGFSMAVFQDCEGGFGRHILDVVLVANEVVEECRKSGKRGVVFKAGKGMVRDGGPGLGDGDPLSHFLFIMVADVLGRMVDRAKKGDESQMVNLFSVLRLFGVLSGLRRVAELFGCGIETFPMKYLGLPLGSNLRGEMFWNPVVEKIRKRLEGWSRALLSCGGKDEGRKDHLVKWETVSLSREKRGLTIGNIVARNMVLLGKIFMREVPELKACAPLKVKVFMWILVHGAL